MCENELYFNWLISSGADITIYPLAILEDNYSYLIVDTNNVAVVVDPADPMVVEVKKSAIKKYNCAVHVQFYRMQ